MMGNLTTHIVQAYVHYEVAFDFQFGSTVYKIPAWSKKDMWENYYYPIFDELADMCERGMYEYLETLR